MESKFFTSTGFDFEGSFYFGWQSSIPFYKSSKMRMILASLITIIFCLQAFRR